MASTTFDKAEIDDFGELAFYILSSREPTNKNVRKPKEGENGFYHKIGQLIALSESAVRNLFSDRERGFTDVSYSIFCDTFLEVYNENRTLKPEKAKDAHDVFIRWVKSISAKTGWPMPTTQPRTDIEPIQTATETKYSEVSEYLLIEKRELAYSMVEKYYSAIKSSEFDEAWSCLSTLNKAKRWNNNLKAFRDEQADTDLTKFDIIDIFDIQENIFECRIECEFFEITSQIDFSLMNNVTDSDIGKFFQEFSISPEEPQNSVTENRLIFDQNEANFQHESIDAKLSKWISVVRSNKIPIVLRGRKQCNNAFKYFRGQIEIKMVEVLYQSLCICKFSGPSCEIDSIRQSMIHQTG